MTDTAPMRERLQGSKIGQDGAEFHHGAALSCIVDLEEILSGLDDQRAGHRLVGLPGLNDVLEATGPIGQLAQSHLPDCRPVRAILLNKSAATNWALGWHQDRTIAVLKRIEVASFGPWTLKQGLLHVEPPFAIIETMVTLRVHIDPVDADNAPLLVSPGTHRLGKIEEKQIPAIVGRHSQIACLADRGDIWAYATPILHASARAARPRRRRVLQVDYVVTTLPGGLEWLGI